MLARLTRPAYGKVAALLTGFDHQLSVAAVLAGAMPGEVFADDAERPSAVFVHSPEGNFVGGDPANARFVAALRSQLTAGFERDGDLVLSFGNHGWLPTRYPLAPDLACDTVARRHYLHRGEQSRPLPDPPAGYQLVPIDAELLRHPRLPAHVRSWIESNWGGEDAFLSGGFGTAALCGEVVAGWSLADCVVADRCEIGIHTAPEHRRLGVATQVAAAAVATAFERGMAQVGWHCNDDNPGSYRTAEAAGFTLRRRYDLFAYHR